VFSFDRDQGIAMLSTVQAFRPPPDALAIKYQVVSSRSSAFVASRLAVGFERSGESGHALADDKGPMTPQRWLPDPTQPPNAPANRRTVDDRDRMDRNEHEREWARARPRQLGDVTPVPRRLARAQIGDASFAMHLDLGAVTSQLPDGAWGRARLAASEAKLHLVDEAASARDVSKAGTALQVALGGATSASVAFVPFVDRRWGTEGVDGALGLDFFQPYAVSASWHAGTYYLKPRPDPAALTVARLGRWGAAMPSCPHAGCITADLVEGNGSLALRVARDAQAANRPLEVFLGVRAAAGSTSPGAAVLPLVVELPAGTDQLLVGLPLDYRGTTLLVLDASPFPRGCEGDRGCVAQIAGPIQGTLELDPVTPTSSGPPGATPGSGGTGGTAGAPAAPQLKLRRVAGEATIPPSADAVAAAAGKPFAAAVVKVCVARDGRIESTKIVKTSGVPAYDAQLEHAIASTWRFDPIELGYTTSAACISATFLPQAR
jgi:hypothetical protein